VALVAAANLILRGDVSEQGVFTAEQAFKPVAFFDECARLLGDWIPEGDLVGESLEYLDPA